jgi:hypothetical protein
MPNYTINELEVLVQEGKFKKKVVKSTYTKEFLSRFYDAIKIGVCTGGIFGGAFGTLGLSVVGKEKPFSDQIFTYGDTITPALIGLLGFGFLGGALGGMQIFYNWKENAKPYINAGGKVIYQEKGLKLKRDEFILPLDHQFDSNEKLDWSIPFRGYIDPTIS